MKRMGWTFAAKQQLAGKNFSYSGDVGNDGALALTITNDAMGSFADSLDSLRGRS